MGPDAPAGGRPPVLLVSFARLRAIAFCVRGSRLHLYTADARPWLEMSRARYDAIFLDAYRQPYIPFYLTDLSILHYAEGQR